MEQDTSTPRTETEKAAPEPEDGSQPGRSTWRPRPLILAFAGVTLLLAAVLGVFLLTAERPVSGSGASAGTGMPQVGGPFELVDHTGKTVTQADFKGKYMLIYFGFTYCPDTCPTALHIMTEAMEELGGRAEQVQPIFISVDPERDTPENMAAYVDYFHERLVGLTGTPDQVREAARAYKVVYKKKQEGPTEADYTMDHSSVVYLMGPDGKYVRHFYHATSPEEMAEGIANVLDGKAL